MDVSLFLYVHIIFWTLFISLTSISLVSSLFFFVNFGWKWSHCFLHWTGIDTGRTLRWQGLKWISLGLYLCFFMLSEMVELVLIDSTWFCMFFYPHSPRTSVHSSGYSIKMYENHQRSSKIIKNHHCIKPSKTIQNQFNLIKIN